MAKITPKSIDSVFDDSVLDALPNNEELGRGIGIARRELNGWDEKNSARYQDPVYKERWTNSIKDAYADPELRQRQSDIHIGVIKSSEHKENIRQARLNSPPRTEETRAKIGETQIGNNKRSKPVTTPYGIYSSLKNAGLALIELGVFTYKPNKAAHSIREYIRDGVSGYAHISKEEYIMLTGKDI